MDWQLRINPGNANQKQKILLSNNSYLLLCTFWKLIFKYFLKEGKNLACFLQVWKSKQGKMKWTASDHPPAKQGQIKVFWSSLKQAVSNAAAHCRALVPTHPVRGPDQDMLQLLIFMRSHFFCSAESKVQVGTEDLGRDAQLVFALMCSLEAHLSLAAQRRSQGSTGWEMPLSCFSMQLTRQQYIP